MPRVIDYDRGVVIKTIADINMDVFMYKDAPGEYLTATGKPVPKELAARAGYDVDFLEREKLRRERRAAAAEAIDKEMELAENPNDKRVVLTVGDYRVVAFGRSDRHAVEDAQGESLTPGVALSRAMAENVARTLAGPAAKAQVVVAQKRGKE